MNSPTKPRVDIVVLNWNSWRDTIDCLQSLQRLAYPNFRTIVLDNGSTDGSLEKIHAWAESAVVSDSPVEEKSGHMIVLKTSVDGRGVSHSRESALERMPSIQRLILLESKKNLGFAEGNNQALRYACGSGFRADYFFLLNNDTRIDPDCLDRAVEAIESTSCAVVGCLIKDMKSGNVLFDGDCRRPELFYSFYYCGSRNSRQDEDKGYQTHMVWGTAMLISRKAVENHERHFGYTFNPELFLYMEDNQLCMELTRHGETLRMAPKAVVYHKHTSSEVNQRHDNVLLFYYVTRNMHIVADRCLGKGWRLLFHIYYPVARLKDLALKMLSGRGREARAIWKGLRDGYLKHTGKWSEHPVQ